MTPDLTGPLPAANLSAGVAGANRRTLDAIFRHPLAHNLPWREVLALFHEIGEAEEKHSGEILFQAGGLALSMNKPHHKDVTAPDMIELRRFLTHAGWSPDAAPSEASPTAEVESLIVVIDHAGARVYRIDRSLAEDGAVVPHDQRRLLHHIERKRHNADRDETYPEDERFFGRVAAAVAGAAPIVVIGHGKGQSNEADHLAAYLKVHHKDVYLRIVREIVADLPGLTTAELLTLGRHAFG
jgi:hypothetical protein